MKTKISLIIVILAFMSIHVFAQNRIIGGQTTDISSRPFQVYVEGHHPYAEIFSCGGGVILNNKWIITAAHVVEGYSAAEIKVYAGSNRVLPMPIPRIVTRKITHPNYSHNNPQYDIALLELTSPLTFTNKIQPVPMNNTTYGLNGTYATVSGWGHTNIDDPDDDGSNVLISANVTINYCTEDYIATTSPTSNPYIGDSGGPLTFYSNGTTKLAGIVCGNGSQQPPYTCQYANIGFLRSWIFSQAPDIPSWEINGPSTIGSNETVTYNYSGSNVTMEIGPNLEEVSHTENSITVRGNGRGNSYIKMLIGNNIMNYKSIWVGGPIIFGITFDGRILRVSTTDNSSIYWTEWNIGGMTYTTYDNFLYLSTYPSGWQNVRVRARNNYGISDYYEEQIYFENNGGYYSINYESESNCIHITPNDFCNTDETHEISYRMANVKNGITAISGTLPYVGGRIDCSVLNSGTYAINISYNGKSYSQKIIIK